jgi:hypothetical protein
VSLEAHIRLRVSLFLQLRLPALREDGPPKESRDGDLVLGFGVASGSRRIVEQSNA